MATGRITRKKNGYTIVPNGFLREKELSWKAKGLMTYLLSMSEEWEVYKSDLSNRSKDGYQSMLSAWEELEKLGYIETIRLKKGNLFTGYDYIIHETPVVAVFVNTETREPENPQLINNSLQELPFKEVDNKLSTNVELPSSTTTVEVSMSERCRRFINAFNEKKIVNGKKSKYKSSDTLTAKLKNRLKNYKPEEILIALGIAMKDDYHKKTNFKYVTPEYILRETILEKFLNAEEGSAPVDVYVPFNNKIDHSNRV